MEKYTLETFCTIKGIGSASGLCYKDNSIYIIGDNSGYLYQYSTQTETFEQFPLIKNPTVNIEKKLKPDFESIEIYGNKLYIFGSGSKGKRNKMVEFDLVEKKKTNKSKLKELHHEMQESATIPLEDFNLEGAQFDGQNWYFLNRGNGCSQKNTLFKLQTENLNAINCSIETTDYSLPEINGVLCCFTDATLIDHKLYFLAAAEGTEDTNNDGEILGTYLGCIDLNSKQIIFTQQISAVNKFEGICLYQKTANQIEFLLCEDNDTELLETIIYRLSVSIN